jgi:hypothetical protein
MAELIQREEAARRPNCCRAGRARSFAIAEGAGELAALGYTKLREFSGGKQDWVAAGPPTEGEK